MERLDKFISDSYTKSRSKARDLIRQGRVQVNGCCVRLADQKVDFGKDIILCDGQRLTTGSKRRVLMLHKPAGCVTATEDREHKTVMEYLPPEYKDLLPVGRLDKDTEGLLLFTDDGDLAHRLISPKYGVRKRYYAEHPGECDAEDVQAFRQGLVLKDGTKCLPAELESLGEGKSLVTVEEGKYHQVRRMLASRGKPVSYLKRIAEGGVSLGDLPLGMTRELTEEEVTSLFHV
ncbi:MAG: rRNA pseudouridine synthase [Oscillospiraceae bacterium]|nr:rRNA pseudouridine synthase [Oscillospiraceae bacterium]